MIGINANMDYSAIFVPLSAPSPKCHPSAYYRTLGHFLWSFCLILLLELTPGFGQLLKDLTNRTYPLTTPSLLLLPLIKTTEVILSITLLKWTKKNSGFTYMLPVKPSFCQKPQEAFP
jgi:hypothetical protein